MLNAQQDWFVKTKAWNTWDRVLQRMGGGFKDAIDVSVEPINDFPGNWDNLKQVNIRKHTTSEPPKNFKHDFPNRIFDNLVHNIGEDYTWFLLNYPILKSLKLDAMNRMDDWNQTGGGIPFILIAKEPFKYKFLLNEWERQLQLNSDVGRRVRLLQYYAILSRVMDSTVDTVVVSGGSDIEPGVYNTYSLGCLGLNLRIDGGVFNAGPFTQVLKLREQQVKSLVLFKPDIERDTVDVINYTLKF